MLCVIGAKYMYLNCQTVFFICNCNLNLLGIFFANGMRIAGHRMCESPLSHISGKEYELTSWKKDAAPKLA